MEIELDINKTVDQNAEVFFNKAKKSRKKIAGAKEAVEKAKLKLIELEKKEGEIKEKEVKKEFKKKWYHKFRWFITSDGFFVIGGRDATTNEILIKKHTDNDDLVFHTNMAGSPFFVIKADKKKITKVAIRETADATATFSKAWKLGLKSQDVFYVKPEQVSKEAAAGEYIAKGAFMIKGKTNYVENLVNVAIGMYKTDTEDVMCGPLNAIKKHCKEYIELEQGDEKSSSVAKKLQNKFNCDLDTIIRVMPSGGIKIK